VKSIPFEIPESLKSYLVTYQDNPEKGISNLEKYLVRRRNDAAGYMLLSLLYHLSGESLKAIKTATQARTLAPGSSLLENLHYFLSHPDGFEAWIPTESVRQYNGNESSAGTPYDIALDLDTLISRLTRANQKRIKISDSHNGQKFSENSTEVDQLATPTLALIFEKQKKYDEAIRVYHKLVIDRPYDADRFRDQITRLEKMT
jgi:tetratricopeptide (TPR) repeat protein